MAGSITVSTISNDTGVFAAQNAVTGIPKAWVNFNGTNAAIRSSFNVSSVTRNSTGNYTISFTTSMPNTNYVIVGQDEINTSTGPKPVTYNTGSVVIITALYTSTPYDNTYNNVAIFSL